MIIKMLAHHYKLTVVDDVFDGNWGQSKAKEGWMKISDKVSVDVFYSTLLHEIIHMASDSLDLGLKNDEAKISALSTAIYSFITENPFVIHAMLNHEKIKT